MKRLQRVVRGGAPHWVGDGFPVRTLFAYPTLGRELSPFLLLDHAGPRVFPPTSARLGVGEHPHRGFETVTIVYAGEVEHRDSSGGGGRIGPGDVQWMTAAAGVVHEELHGAEFARRGGEFEMAQLWVNLPAKDKRSAPRYQSLLASEIPVVDLGEGRGTLRVIAGEHALARGPARTFTPMDVWDVHLASDQALELPVPSGHTTALVVLRGSVRAGDAERVEADQVALFEREGDSIRLEAGGGATLLVLAGRPIDEPIAGQGPFVMNHMAEIRQAMVDYQEGRMGHLA